MSKVTLQDYPLFNNLPDLIETLTGKSLNEITVEAILNGEVSDLDVRISPKTLELQAQIAEQAGRWFVAQSFRRAAELCIVPDDKVMHIYESLRPHRCTAEEMEAMAIELEENYGAVLNAALIREASQAYAERGFLNKPNNIE